MTMIFLLFLFTASCQCMEGGGRGGWVAGVGQRGGSQEDGDVVLAFQPTTFGYSIKPRHLHCK